jgi:8-hydroxy-5-deazaflavin:NADPH oxidoreductase
MIAGPQGVAAAMTTIGFIGSGHIGTALARATTARGYDVVMSNSRGPETLSGLVGELGPRARAATAAEAAAAGDLVVVTIPLGSYAQVPVEPLAGKVVLDTDNYYPDRDGRIAELEDESTTTSEIVQRHLAGARVVKAFNHIYAADLVERATPPGTPHRRALAIAGDDPSAKNAASSYIDTLGFDVVDLGPLAEGWRVQRDTPGYVTRLDRAGLERAAAAAQRYRDGS